MAKVPVIDLSECTDCESCIALCPAVFQKNRETGQIEIKEAAGYSEREIDEVIAMCPADCISWEEDETRTQCPDCDQCQACSQDRCRLCKKGGCAGSASELGGAFTHGQYLAWKKKRASGVPVCPGQERRGRPESCAQDHKA